MRKGENREDTKRSQPDSRGEPQSRVSLTAGENPKAGEARGQDIEEYR